MFTGTVATQVSPGLRNATDHYPSVISEEEGCGRVQHQRMAPNPQQDPPADAAAWTAPSGTQLKLSAKAWTAKMVSVLGSRGTWEVSLWLSFDGVLRVIWTVHTVLLGRLYTRECFLDSISRLFMCNGDVICFLWGANWIYIHYLDEV
jgi:hypothetical protein